MEALKENFYNKSYFKRLCSFLDKVGLKYEVKRNYFKALGVKYRLMKIEIPSINIKIHCGGTYGVYAYVDCLGYPVAGGEFYKSVWVHPLKIGISSGEVYIGMRRSRIEGNVYKVEDFSNQDREMTPGFLEFIEKIRYLGNNALSFIESIPDLEEESNAPSFL